MKVEQIRQDSHVEEYVRLHVDDVKTVLVHRDSFVRVPCPACGEKDSTPKFEKSGFSFVECPACTTLYINPRPCARRLTDFYTSSQAFGLFNTKIYPASEDTRRKYLFAPRAQRVVQLCRQYLSSPLETIVDVGAGFGTFCEEIRRLRVFSRVIAVEPSPGLAATCRRKGLEVVEKPIEEAPQIQATVVVCFELIEHLFSPHDFLLACGRVLGPGGLLILTTPNIEGFDLRVLGPLSENIDGPEHLNYFSPASLRRLLNCCGFRVAEVLTPGKLDAELVRKKALAGALDLSAQPLLQHVLVDEWDRLGGPFQEFLAAQGLSSHMWAVARRCFEKQG